MDNVYTVSTDNTIKMDDFVTIYQGGKLVGTVKVTVDFSDCPLEFAQYAMSVLRPMRLGMPTNEDLERSARWSDEQEKKKERWNKLGWFGKLKERMIGDPPAGV